jgi:uncharacterized protein YkwD
MTQIRNVRPIGMRAPIGVLGALALWLGIAAWPTSVRAGVVDAINDVRESGCDGRRGASAPLKSSRKLNSVARRLARGEKLSSALDKENYRALRSASMFISNMKSDAEVARTLAQRACGQLRNDEVREIGVDRQGANIWIVLAAPFGAPELKNASDVTAEALKLANQARSRGRRCGGEQYPAVPPLKLESRLTKAALAHAKDMARHSMLEHEGTDGSSPAVRISRTGYTWRTIGENIASGPITAEEVMAGWLASPDHCANLMSPRFTEMGLAYVVDPNSRSGVYWAQEFATPK